MGRSCACMLEFLSAILLVSLASGGIELGSKLGTDSHQPWVSSENTFVFGFQASNTSTGTFNLAIWYRVTPNVAVWTASQQVHGKPLQVGKDAEVLLGGNGLTVTDGSQAVVWSTQLGCESCVASAEMTDAGNFVLLNTSDQPVWESFHSPTDTLLPNQELVGNMSLVSGSYSLSMNASSVGLYYDGYSLNDSYWNILNQQFNSGSSPPKLTFAEDGNMTFYDASGAPWYRQKYDNSQRYTLDYQDPDVVLRRITLESNGTLRSYSLTKDAATWRVVWQSNLLECEVYGTCGAFGVCSYAPRKSCSCPPGFSPVNGNDAGAGCSYKVPLQCNGTGSSKRSESKMVQLDRTTYMGNDYVTAQRSMSLEGCKSLCLEDCKCLAAVYLIDGSGQCVLKGGSSNGTLYNGIQSAQQAVIGLIKVSALDTSATSPKDVDGVFVTWIDGQNMTMNFTASERRGYFSETHHVVVFALAVGELVFFCAVALVSWFCWRRSIQQMWKKAASDKRGATRFSYEQLQLATNNFSEKLGSGGFGSVYKGILPDKRVVAVKCLEVATHVENQFKAEVITLGRIHHVNLVRLLGYCAEENHKMLVYEYMSNGSLDKVLFCSDTSLRLHKLWETRYSVALGIAKGIAYLHEECYERILHCDIKPQNILLDEDFCPKVSDFGLAKLMKKEVALSVTTIRGTRGYLAPEWISNQPITAKVDVYSYGMVLLELLTGRDVSIANTTSNVPVWAFQKYSAGELQSIIDPKLLVASGQEVDWSEFEKTLKVAVWCIQPDANLRPTMRRVVQMLEDHDSEVVVPPSPGVPASVVLEVKESGEANSGSSTGHAQSMSILEPR